MYQLIEPYGAGLEPKTAEGTQQKLSIQGSQLEKSEVGVVPASGFRCMSPDRESREIKNIYIDCKLLTLSSLKFFSNLGVILLLCSSVGTSCKGQDLTFIGPKPVIALFKLLVLENAVCLHV